VYATCSLLQAENDEVADCFEASNGGGQGKFVPWRFSDSSSGNGDSSSGGELTAGLATRVSGNRKLLLPCDAPLQCNTDGFFICRWTRL
jgi:16S rRNA C967 or C1407 C5-methylase (RsmB/RsmF family)